MIILKAVTVVIISAIVSIIIRSYKPEFTVFIAIASTFILWTVLNPAVENTLSVLRTMLNGTGVNSEYVVILLKSLGICILTQTASNICRDANESALATKAEIAGKIIMISISLPMITSIAEIAVELIEK